MATSETPAIVQKLQARRDDYLHHGKIYRTAWVIAGFIVVLAGIAMIVFPGPAIVVIPLGLAMLSFEFAWAQRLLDKALSGGLDAKDAVARATKRQKIMLAVAVVLAVAAVGAVAVAFLSR